MSKISKLFNNPGLFFRDWYKNRTLNQKSSGSSKPAVAKTFMTSNANLMLPFEIMIHTGEDVISAVAHVDLWISEFANANKHFIILSRNAKAYSALIKKYPFHNIALATKPLEVEALVLKLPSLRKIFYPSSTSNNLHLQRFNHYQHIFIGHGDSDKASSAHKGLRSFDTILVAGEAHIDRFRNSGFKIAGLEFIKVGKPTSFNILKKSTKLWSERMELSPMYLPTWEGQINQTNYSSLHLSADIMRIIHDKLKVRPAVKFHPSTGKRDLTFANIESNLIDYSHKQKKNFIVHPSSESMEDLIEKSNFYVCDISASVTSCLASDAPIFLYYPLDKEISLAKSAIGFEDYCYIFNNLEGLEKLLQKVIVEKNDTLKTKRSAAVDYFLSRKETLQHEFRVQISI